MSWRLAKATGAFLGAGAVALYAVDVTNEDRFRRQVVSRLCLFIYLLHPS